MIDKATKRKIEEHEKRIQQLEARPVYVPYPPQPPVSAGCFQHDYSKWAGGYTGNLSMII